MSVAPLDRGYGNCRSLLRSVPTPAVLLAAWRDSCRSSVAGPLSVLYGRHTSHRSSFIAPVLAALWYERLPAGSSASMDFQRACLVCP